LTSRGASSQTPFQLVLDESDCLVCMAAKNTFTARAAHAVNG
jgi:hypothetical protein